MKNLFSARTKKSVGSVRYAQVFHLCFFFFIDVEIGVLLIEFLVINNSKDFINVRNILFLYNIKYFGLN